MGKYKIKGFDRKALKKAGMKPLPLMMHRICTCNWDYKPGKAIPVSNVKTLECAKCGGVLSLPNQNLINP